VLANDKQEPHLIWHLKDTPPHPDQHLGLHQVLGISHGKKTDVLKAVEAPDSHLFTLHTTESAMNLEANSQVCTFGASSTFPHPPSPSCVHSVFINGIVTDVM
jgi:hypothetical protein